MKKVSRYSLPLPVEQLYVPFRDAYNRSGFSSYQELSAATGIADYTLSRFFAGTTKEPSLCILSRVAQALNKDLGYNFLSLDSILGIADADAGRCPEHAGLESRLRQLQEENARLADLRERSARSRTVHALLLIIVILCLTVAYLILDATNPSWGLFR